MTDMPKREQNAASRRNRAPRNQLNAPGPTHDGRIESLEEQKWNILHGPKATRSSKKSAIAGELADTLAQYPLPPEGKHEVDLLREYAAVEGKSNAAKHRPAQREAQSAKIKGSPKTLSRPKP